MTLRDLGLSLTRRAPRLEAAARRFYGRLPAALHDTPTSRMRAFFRRAAAVSFVQIGAYDGLAGDPLRPLVLENPDWRGVLVEPQPAAFAALRSNYAAQSGRLAFVNAAVAPKAGEMTLYVVADDETARSLPDWARETASFDRRHVEKHFGDRRIDGVAVATLPFDEVAALLPGGTVDLVVIDVEGYEADLLDMIDFDRHRTRFVVYEHKHLDDLAAGHVERRLGGFGFRLKRFGRDTIAWRQERRR